MVAGLINLNGYMGVLACSEGYSRWSHFHMAEVDFNFMRMTWQA